MFKLALAGRIEALRQLSWQDRPVAVGQLNGLEVNMTCLRLALLGAFEASLDEKPLSGIKKDKARVLLTYLAAER
jgi:hypothetical protein